MEKQKVNTDQIKKRIKETMNSTVIKGIINQIKRDPKNTKTNPTTIIIPPKYGSMKKQKISKYAYISCDASLV